ncbi:MAG: hypothetical protein RL540_156 [Actinomycetota bacterium]|jgi:hypothetical protein
MIRNPFGKPYLFSKKWAIWLLIGVPFVLYSNYTDPNFQRSELVTTTVTILMIFVILPWILIRITRAISGKDPQGKTYDENGLVIEGDVLNLKYGYFPRNRVRAILRDGVVEFPTSKIKVKDIQSIKTKDPRPLNIKLPLYALTSILTLIYFYFILQVAILLFLKFLPILEQKMGSQEVISDDQRFQQLRSNKFLSKVIYSQDLQGPLLTVVAIFIFAVLIKVFFFKISLIITTRDGETLMMPFSLSVNPYVQLYVEMRRVKRFIKRVKKAQKTIEKEQI